MNQLLVLHDQCISDHTRYIRFEDSVLAMCPNCRHASFITGVIGSSEEHVTIGDLVFDVIRMKYVRTCEHCKLRAETYYIICPENRNGKH